ncbi:hypothetical protein KHF85_03780 [Xanthomonas translucens pv. graminis]|uniref:hypothetical protein n=1 Tax=Xanthomonas graminis TaxID=3390026 RepID=UPI00253FAF93|nr:hypothetical protein [Xanthomonas translucens]WIH05622.1 hypothetical protein KHF85_03780 [Xanthomonas translucens pv. graminis]
MNDLHPPKVPQKLLDILKDYPALVDRLQYRLNSVLQQPSKMTPPFELAIWLLEDELGSFISEARKELEIARVSGDPVSIENARKKDFAVGYARLNMGGMADLRAYFEENRGRL